MKQNHTDELQRRAKEFCSDKVDDLPLVTGMGYLPANRDLEIDEDNVSEDTLNRMMLLVFKDSDRYDAQTVNAVQKMFVGWLTFVLEQCFQEYLGDITLIPCPAHSQELTDIRWFNFMNKVVQKLEKHLYIVENGYKYIDFVEDAPVASHVNRKAPKAKFRYKNLQGKNIILVDDLITSGNTIRRNRIEVEKAGGKVIAAFVFAKTKSQ
jgi:phosphoribosylpyrophosphate synthetase